MRITMSRKRAEARAIREVEKKEFAAMDEEVSRAKRATVKRLIADRRREEGAKRKAADEKKRIAAGVALLKEIYARKHGRKENCV